MSTMLTLKDVHCTCIRQQIAASITIPNNIQYASVGMYSLDIVNFTKGVATRALQLTLSVAAGRRA